MGGMVKKRLTHEQIEQVLQKLRDGVSMYQIADEFGIEQSSVYYHAKKHNIVRPRAKDLHKRPIHADSIVFLALQLHAEEKSYSEIARDLQISRQGVQQSIKRYQKFQAETVS